MDEYVDNTPITETPVGHSEAEIGPESISGDEDDAEHGLDAVEAHGNEYTPSAQAHVESSRPADGDPVG